jgi:hypothetical protein
LFVGVLASSHLLGREALASSVSNSFSTDGWIVTYDLSSSSAEPGSALSLQVEIHALKTSYTFELEVVVPAPLSIKHQGSDDPVVRFSQLTEGEQRLESFSITVLGSVKVGEIYTINFKAKSSATKPIVPGVYPLWPDFQFDTSSVPAKSLSVSVVGLARLAIGQAIYQRSVTRGDIFTVSVPLSNTGTGTAKSANLKVAISEGLRLNSVSGFINGSDIAPGQTVQLTIVVLAVREGTELLELTLSSQSAQIAKQSLSVEVKAPLDESVGQWVSDYWWLILIAFLGVLALVYLALRGPDY